MKTISYIFPWIIVLLMIQPLSGQVPEVGYINISSGGGKVYLSWQLLPGATCLGIQVHRASDDLIFEEIGKIEGVCGDLNQPQSYSFIDDDPPLNQRSFYRLELGTGNFTDTLFVYLTDFDGNTYQVRPHPVTSGSQLHFSNERQEDHRLIISDISGKMVYSQHTRNDHFTINAAYFSPGLYLFSITPNAPGNAITGKLLILPQ